MQNTESGFNADREKRVQITQIIAHRYSSLDLAAFFLSFYDFRPPTDGWCDRCVFTRHFLLIVVVYIYDILGADTS